VLDPFKHPITRKLDSCMSKNLNSKLKKEDDSTCDPSKHGVEGLPGALGRRQYGERSTDCMNYVNNLLSN
jgi:hypothetical protein